jgi:hypothetical protein
MWSLILVVSNNIFPVALIHPPQNIIYQKQTISNVVSQVDSKLSSWEIAQSQNVEAVSPSGYSLKYPASWKPFATQYFNPNSDIFLGRIIPSSTNTVITITTTIKDFLTIPKNLPSDVKKFDRVAETYAGLMYRTGYKIYEVKPVMINQRRGVRLTTETPDKKGSITVLIEGKNEKMVVSTAIYPMDNPEMNRETLEQVITEIGEIQNSITLR